MQDQVSGAEPASRTKSGIVHHWLVPLCLIVASVIVSLLIFEIGCRLWRGGPSALLHWPNLVLKARVDAMNVSLANHGGAYRHDDTLGFANLPGYTSSVQNYDSDGLRLMPPLSADAVQAPPILATGDSYTKGDEVADFHSWPAQLQEILDWRTLNAGVGGFGIDQIVLLTEQLVQQFKPGVIVLGFIADDIRRAEHSRIWGREKSYFQQVGSDLLLRNVPVPQSPGPHGSLNFLETMVGWSKLVDEVLVRLNLRSAWHQDDVRAMPRGEGVRLSCPLMRRVAALGVPTLVVAQYLPVAWHDPVAAAEEHRQARMVLDCADRAGLATLDLHDLFAREVRRGGRNAIYKEWHPNERGYRLIAEAIAADLRRRNMLKP